MLLVATGEGASALRQKRRIFVTNDFGYQFYIAVETEQIVFCEQRENTG